jgi:hypothetical protein
MISCPQKDDRDTETPSIIPQTSPSEDGAEKLFKRFAIDIHVVEPRAIVQIPFDVIDKSFPLTSSDTTAINSRPRMARNSKISLRRRGKFPRWH